MKESLFSVYVWSLKCKINFKLIGLCKSEDVHRHKRSLLENLKLNLEDTCARWAGIEFILFHRLRGVIFQICDEKQHQ